MIEKEEDDGSWASAFQNTFKGREGLERRLKDERRAGRTPKQRAAKKPPKKQLNIRATDDTHVLLDKLADHLESTVTDVIERAIAQLAQSEGLK
jgi:hypothetical protein